MDYRLFLAHSVSFYFAVVKYETPHENNTTSDGEFASGQTLPAVGIMRYQRMGAKLALRKYLPHADFRNVPMYIASERRIDNRFAPDQIIATY